MKNQTSELNETVLTLASESNSCFNQNKIIYCPQKNKSTQLCFNPKCINNAFICNQEKCSCQQNHLKCFTSNQQKFIKAIQSKIISTSFLQNFLQTKVQELINLISDFHDEMKKIIKNDTKYLGLNQNEKQFLIGIAQGHLPPRINGSDIWKVIHPLQQQMPIDDFINQNIQILERQLQDTQNILNNCFSIIKQEVKAYKDTIFQGSNSIVANFINSKQKSKIINQLNQAKIIKNLFHPLKIKSAKLLYRASQNNFQVKKFHQKCDGFGDTMVLVETEFGKKIGGYTPVKWSSPNSGTYMNDQSMSSFLFSLTENDKFNLVNKDKAIRNNLNWGPIFGEGYDLIIDDKANTNNQSNGKINHTYKNQKYEGNQKKAWEKFIGNAASAQFKVKQWEVWSLQFV